MFYFDKRTKQSFQSFIVPMLECGMCAISVLEMSPSNCNLNLILTPVPICRLMLVVVSAIVFKCFQVFSRFKEFLLHALSTDDWLFSIKVWWHFLNNWPDSGLTASQSFWPADSLTKPVSCFCCCVVWWHVDQTPCEWISISSNNNNK